MAAAPRDLDLLDANFDTLDEWLEDEKLPYAQPLSNDVRLEHWPAPPKRAEALPVTGRHLSWDADWPLAQPSPSIHGGLCPVSSVPELTFGSGETANSLPTSLQRPHSLEDPALLRNGEPHKQYGAAERSSQDKLRWQRLTERNKQAQRKFRQRQKEKVVELQAEQARVDAEVAALRQETARLDSLCETKDDELRKVKERQTQAAKAEEDELSQAFQGGMTLTYSEEATITLTPEQIKTMSAEELARHWGSYIKMVAVLLVRVEGEAAPPSDDIERIQELVRTELLYLYIRAALTNMQSVKEFIAKARIVEDRRRSNPEGASNRWRELSRNLRLSAEQSQAVVASWRAFVGSIDALLAERKRMHRELTATAHAGLCGRDSAEKNLRANDLMQQLKKNLRAEHVLIHEFLVNWYTRILTTIQAARCIVKSHPFYPDIPAIAAWVAVACDDRLAVSKLPLLESQNSPASSA